jgi:hypothetical protein
MHALCTPQRSQARQINNPQLRAPPQDASTNTIGCRHHTWNGPPVVQLRLYSFACAAMGAHAQCILGMAADTHKPRPNFMWPPTQQPASPLASLLRQHSTHDVNVCSCYAPIPVGALPSRQLLQKLDAKAPTHTPPPHLSPYVPLSAAEQTAPCTQHVWNKRGSTNNASIPYYALGGSKAGLV